MAPTGRKFRIPPLHKIIQSSDYTITTWLLLGATLQCLLSTFLPRNISLLPAIALLGFRITRGYLIATGICHNPMMEGVNLRYTTTQFPDPEDSAITRPRSDHSIVVLVLASTFHHPNGRFCPGAPQVGAYFRKMWRDAEVNASRYGYLGNTPALVAEVTFLRAQIPDTTCSLTIELQPDDGLGSYGTWNKHQKGRQEVYLSYWKTLDGLHEFAHSKAHRDGWLAWERGIKDKFKYIGIMHEVYEVPAGNWENIFSNFRPFAIGKFAFWCRCVQSVRN